MSKEKRCAKCGVLVGHGMMKGHKARCNPEEIKKLNKMMDKISKQITM